MQAFHRLHPRLRHGIVHDLGWPSLRPVQELSIDAILDGDNAVVLAPTAGGKTEASVFPVLSRILTEDAAPVSALYICPIRALLNNQEHRLRQYARMVGLDVFKWHGDVAASKKRSFVAEPTHLLMTTPESLEVMLMGTTVDAEALFRGLRAVIIDEVHAFAADDRGAHLVSILERLTRYAEHDIQRIGLSATVGNPAEIGHWLQGSSARPTRLVDPPRPPAQRELRLDYCPEPDVLAHRLAQAATHHKSLVFVESRRQAERTAQTLSQHTPLDVYVHHSAVSRADRERAEAAFIDAGHAAIVCTSTMELGIDVGELDRVLQIGAPNTVASFLQRLGRTGRRPGRNPNCAFFCAEPEHLLRALALLRLAHRGEVEHVIPPKRALHVLAHQILALSLQQGGISRWQVTDWVAQATPFQGLTPAEVQSLVDTMLARDILHDTSGRLILGHRGEALYGSRNFFELYAVFSTPPIVQVLHGRVDIGTVDATFIKQHDPADGPLRFRLAGRSWQTTHYDEARGRLHVKPAPTGVAPNWMGTPGALSFALCQEMKATLHEPTPEESTWLTPDAQQELAALRQEYDGLVEPHQSALELRDTSVQWHTFAGARINRVLATLLNPLTDRRWRVGNLSLHARDLPQNEATRALHALRTTPAATLAQHAADAVTDHARGRLTKFQPCLDDPTERHLLVERLLDVDGAVRMTRGAVGVVGEL